MENIKRKINIFFLILKYTDSVLNSAHLIFWMWGFKCRLIFYFFFLLGRPLLSPWVAKYIWASHNFPRGKDKCETLLPSRGDSILALPAGGSRAGKERCSCVGDPGAHSWWAWGAGSSPPHSQPMAQCWTWLRAERRPSV